MSQQTIGRPAAKPQVRAPKRTLASVVTRKLRERIVAGEIPPGTQMNEVELATTFATSRGPVREGMQRLVQEGLLISAPHRGIFVPVLAVADLEDLYFTRAALERAAVERVTARGLTAQHIGELERTVEDMQIAVDQDDDLGVTRADMLFHQALVDAAESPRLSQMFMTLAGQTRLGLNLLIGVEDCVHLVEEHTAIYRALVARDRGVATTLLDRHFDDSLRTLSAKFVQASVGPGDRPTLIARTPRLRVPPTTERGTP